ncbi:DNA polymerase-3 subunit delta' [Natranaerovirga hydrolytica]|uniref:DNA polymerase III subunit delta' n=1 Tax=Natranaerovirga hydrolytica TaxID=680378 RepID=A0A4R1N1U5_9FIRM|nr:DNA polymerase III subunit delta' [Natranaerovirga hydrolytica]TCL00038.1 DNA polymerase-3 subunit delta' [Natranaerovirga hydrolytica]
MYSFNDIIGYEDIKNHFKKSIQSNKISHAYIISGPKGMGKKLIANVISKTLQCEKGEEEPCNACTSCKQYDSNNNPDVKFVHATKTKSIGVDDIREQVNKDIHIKPYSYKNKIYIIDEADTLTEQAQNALLKTIEEPPEYGIIFLLVNHTNNMLPTILSRCVVLQLKPIQETIIKDYLMRQYKIEPQETNLYVSMAQGNIGKAQELVISDEFRTMRMKAIDLLKKINTLSDIEMMNVAPQLEEYKDHIEDFLDIMITWYRDLLVIKSTQESENIIHQDYYGDLLKNSEDLTYNQIGNAINKLEETKNIFKNNVNYQLALESLLFKLRMV